jgi:hypothetical protein
LCETPAKVFAQARIMYEAERYGNCILKHNNNGVLEAVNLSARQVTRQE